MSTMICACGKAGIYWKNLTGLQPYTYCPHCGGTNCQVADEQESESDNQDEERSIHDQE